MQRNKQELPGSPAEWLRYARSDYRLAAIRRPKGVMLDTLCYHAQQAAEKAIKAFLLHRRASFPFTHNLKTLLECLPKSVQPPTAVLQAARLTQYAVSARYPDDAEPVSSETERQTALRLARAVLTWAKKEIEQD
jgi:HEPN domain-containing protein